MDDIRPFGKHSLMRRRRATAREGLNGLADALKAARGADVLPTLEDGPGPEGGPEGYSETLQFTGRMRERIDELTADVAEALRLLDEHEAHEGYDD